MKTKSIGFFSRFILSFTDQRIYPIVVRESLLKAFWYFLRLVLVCCLFMAFFSTSRLFDTLPEYVDKIENEFPNFEVFYDKLEVDENKEVVLGEGTLINFTNTNKAEFDINEYKQAKGSKYTLYLMAFNDVLEVYTNDEEIGFNRAFAIGWKEFSVTDKEEILTTFRAFSTSFVAKIFMFCFISMMILSIYGFNRLVVAFLLSLSTALLDMMFKTGLKYKDYFKIAFYVSSLPTFLETIAIIKIQTVPELAEFIEILIATIYIYVALRACKLTAILEQVAKEAKGDKDDNNDGSNQ